MVKESEEIKMTKEELQDFIDNEIPSILSEIEEQEEFNKAVMEISKNEDDGSIKPPELRKDGLSI